MEKMLFKKIAGSFAVVGLVFFILFSHLYYSDKVHSIVKQMDEMMMQIETAYEKTVQISERLNHALYFVSKWRMSFTA